MSHDSTAGQPVAPAIRDRKATNGGSSRPATTPRAVTPTIDWVGQIGNALGVLSASAVVVFISGGTALVSRLYVYKLDALEVVVGQIPQAILISTGLVEVMAPMLAVAGLYITWRLVLGKGDHPLFRPWSKQDQRYKFGYLASATAVGILAWVIPTGYWLVVRGGGCLQGCAGAGLAGLVVGSPGLLDRLTPTPFWTAALVANVLFVVIAFLAAARLADTSPEQWNQFTRVAPMTAIWAVALMPAFVTVDAGLPLAAVRVCISTGQTLTPIDGYLVAQTTDGVFIADGAQLPDPDASRRLITVPTSRIVDIYTGGSSINDACPAR